MGRFIHFPRPDIRENTTLYQHAGKEPILVPKKGPNEHTKILGVKPFFFRKDTVEWRKKKMPWGDQQHVYFNNHSNGTPEQSAVSPETPEQWVAARRPRGRADVWGDVWYDASEDVHGIPIVCGLWTMWHPVVPWKEFDYIVQLFAMHLAGHRMSELHYVSFPDIHTALRAMDLDAWGPRWSQAAEDPAPVQEIWRRVLHVVRTHPAPDLLACRAFANAFKGFGAKQQHQAMMHTLRTAQRQRDIMPNTGNHYDWFEPGNARNP